MWGALWNWNFRHARFIEFAKIGHMPSDYTRTQVKTTVKGERSTIEARHDVGVSTLMWASNPLSRPGLAGGRAYLQALRWPRLAGESPVAQCPTPRTAASPTSE